jgi:rubrerythrin
MAMGKSQVMVTCKKCGQQSPADSFRLDYEYKMVVCPNCFSRKSGASNARPGMQNVSTSNAPSMASKSNFSEQSTSRTPIRNTPFAEDKGFKSANQAWKEKEDAERRTIMGANIPKVRNTPFYDESAQNQTSNIGSVPVRNTPKAGWDREDEFLELSMLKKREDEEKFQPKSVRMPQSQVIGPDVIAVKCYFCNYTFKYNIEKQSPKLCPNCGKVVDNSMF